MAATDDDARNIYDQGKGKGKGHNARDVNWSSAVARFCEDFRASHNNRDSTAVGASSKALIKRAARGLDITEDTPSPLPAFINMLELSLIMYLHNRDSGILEMVDVECLKISKLRGFGLEKREKELDAILHNLFTGKDVICNEEAEEIASNLQVCFPI